MLLVRFEPAMVGTRRATLPITVAADQPVCGAIPTELRLEGEGAGPGVLRASTTTVSFGNNACGSAPLPRTVTVENPGAIAATYTVELSVGSTYTVTPASGTIPANSSATLTVTPAPVRQDFNVPVALDSYFIGDVSDRFIVRSGTNRLVFDIDAHAIGSALFLDVRSDAALGLISVYAALSPRVIAARDYIVDLIPGAGCMTTVNNAPSGGREREISAQCTLGTPSMSRVFVTATTDVGVCSVGGDRAIISLM